MLQAEKPPVRMGKGQGGGGALENDKRKMDTRQLPHCSWEDPLPEPGAAVVSPREVPTANPRIETGLLGASHPPEG